MLKEAIDTIREMADDANVNKNTPVFVEVDKRKTLATKTKEGDIFISDAERGPARSHRATDLETVVAFALRFKDKNPAIWYSRAGVVCLIDDEDREDTIKLTLRFSDQFAQLVELNRTKAKVSQRDMILLLRSTFKDCLMHNADLVKQLRTVKVQSGGTTELQRGKSSEGRQIAAEIGSQYEPPEYLSLSIPVFLDQIGTGLQTVQCVFEVHEDGPTFQLFPLPAELECAAVDAEVRIHDRIVSLLGESSVPCYFGTP